MWSDKLAMVILVGVLSGSVAGCVSTSTRNEDALSNKEKAALNLEIGVRYLDMGMLDVAKEKLEAAYALDSRNASVNNALAVFYERIGQRDKAREYYQQAMDFNPEDAGVKNNYGRFLCEHGNYEEGMALLREAAQMPMNGRKWFALTNLGLCHMQQNQMEQAEQAFRHALQVQPDYAPALMEMQRVSYQRRKYMSARAFLERYLGVAQHTPQTLWVAIQTERALGNRALAEKYQQQLLSSFPDSEQAKQIGTVINR